jgi:hypothetical protein
MDAWMDGKEDGRHPSAPDLEKEKIWMRTIHDLWSILKDTRGAQNSLICRVMKTQHHQNPDFGHTWGGEIQFWW